MDVLARAAPPAGSAETGDLYVDLQTRTLWIGVDPAIDPSEFVLISDILALEAEIAGSLVEAKAYTDTQVALKAPLVHTHTASQITDFSAAVVAVTSTVPELQWVTGMIMLWSGSIADVGVGPLAGWHLCDGEAGTPDLRDRFIIGAGNKTPGSVNPLVEVLTDIQGSHTHTINGTALTEAHLGSHAHVTGPYRAYGATYGGAGNHAHSIWGPHWAGFMEHDSSDEGDRGVPSGGFNAGSGAAGAHDHSCFVDIHVATDYRGGNQAHTHTANSNGLHQHKLTSNEVRDVLPFYALAYIMKID